MKTSSSYRIGQKPPIFILGKEMLKVFGFVSRNSNLTHDEYRAGHVGYHNSYGRRLNNIRGYILNVRSNRDLSKDFPDSLLLKHITKAEPNDFDAQWDGYGQLNFDNLIDYQNARGPAKDRAGVNGLEYDEMVGKVGDDFRYLYSGSPFQFSVDEHVQVSVRRPEKKLFKLVQFVKRPDSLSPILFRSYLSGRYCSQVAKMTGLKGLILNLRSTLDVMTGFFAPDSEGFTPAGNVRRNLFYSLWDAMIEYWFEEPNDFFSGRLNESMKTRLDSMELEFFASSFYREVDETVAVIPNRDWPPDFYHR